MAGNVFPISLNQTLLWKVRNFPDDIYNFDPQDNLTILMSILLGNAGVGQLSMVQTAARINQQNLEFSDIERVLGNILGLPRLPSETYTLATNPFRDQLLVQEWADILSTDAQYRGRLDGSAYSRMLGATPMGLKSMADITAGTRAKMVEVWNTPTAIVSSNYTVTVSGQTYTTLASGTVIVSGTQTTASGYFYYPVISGSNATGAIASGYVGYTTAYTTRGFNNNEIVFYPTQLPDVPWSSDTQNGIVQALETIKTTGSIVTVNSPTISQDFVQLPAAKTSNNIFVTSGNMTIISGNSQFFYMSRQVLANNVSTPANTYRSISLGSGISAIRDNGRYWLVNDQQTLAPYFAHMITQESNINVTQNISTVNITPIQPQTASPASSYSSTLMLGAGLLNITATVYGDL